MCGRRKMESTHPELCDWGDMSFFTVQQIAEQVDNVIVQFHWNGEPLLYPHLGAAIHCFSHCHTGLDTNGKLLLEKFDDIQLLDTITISIIPGDPEGVEQYKIIDEFLREKPKPLVILRLLGNDVANEFRARVLKKTFPYLQIAKRVLHAPEGSHAYEKPVTIPEMGVCLEMLSKLAIDRYGNVSPCVRYDPKGLNVLDNINNESLENIWYGEKRNEWVGCHLKGRRDRVPLCGECHFYGLPRG
jgi:radical SAM protein with 4Fe4S-binding SPASM domain